MEFLPDLAARTPLWLSLVTVGVNSLVGALRATVDEEHHWDIVGMTTFAVLMGLGGGFIRDLLVGNLPVESLRGPWYLTTVLGTILGALLVGRAISRLTVVVDVLNALALGLFAVTGAAYALRAELPVISAIFVGVASAVGGGVLVSVVKDEVPAILTTSAPNALVALAATGVYAAVAAGDTRAAAVAGITVAVVIHLGATRLGLRTRRATDPTALLLTRTKGARTGKRRS